ncbi:hypothetical protein ABVT39_010694 [Epinephelus coioides]
MIVLFLRVVKPVVGVQLQPHCCLHWLNHGSFLRDHNEQPVAVEPGDAEVVTPSSGVDVVLLLIWLVAVVADTRGAEVVLTADDAVVLLAVLGAVVEETDVLLVLVLSGGVSDAVGAKGVLVVLLFGVLGPGEVDSVDDVVLTSAGVEMLLAVVSEAVDAEVVLSSAGVDAAVLPVVLGAVVPETVDAEVVFSSVVVVLFVVLGAVVTRTDKVVLISAGVDALLLVWLVAVVADTRKAEVVLTFNSADVAEKAVDDVVAMSFAGVGIALLLVVLGVLGCPVVKTAVGKKDLQYQS